MYFSLAVCLSLSVIQYLIIMPFCVYLSRYIGLHSSGCSGIIFYLLIVIVCCLYVANKLLYIIDLHIFSIPYPWTLMCAKNRIIILCSFLDIRKNVEWTRFLSTLYTAAVARPSLLRGSCVGGCWLWWVSVHGSSRGTTQIYGAVHSTRGRGAR